MIKLFFTTVCFMTLTVFAMSGCSKGEFPTVPGQDEGTISDSQSSFPVGVSEYDQNGDPAAGYGALGLFQVHVDSETLTGEMTSLRNMSSTDVLEIVDITNFLMVFPCNDCVELKSIEMNSDRNLVLKIGIRHPFSAGNSEAPITGRNRGDLHVFNIEGTIVAESNSSTNFAGIGKVVDNFKLLNADGYSSYLDNALDIDVLQTTANLHPYILHFADYSAGNFSASNEMGFQSVTTPPPSGNLVMAMGSTMDYRDYVFDLSQGDIDFILAIGCTYAITTKGKVTRFNPEYRVPQHLKKAASEVSVRIVNNNLVGGTPSSDAEIAIDVVDMSHGVAIGDALDQMAHDSSVSGIKLEIPGITSGVKNVTLTNTGGTGHSGTDPLTYTITLNNELSADDGMYQGLVKVVDSYPTGMNSGGLTGFDGIKRAGPTDDPTSGLFAISEFATYQTFTINVAESGNQAPVAILLPETPAMFEGNTVEFDASTSYDPDGSIVTYEFMWDWDLVPSNFIADISGSIAVVTSAPYPTQGTYHAGLRVTDNNSAVAYDSVEVTVNVWTSECPSGQFGGDPITQNFTLDDWYSFYSSPAGWVISGTIIDCDMLSTHWGVCIYSNPSAGIDGEMRYFNPVGNLAPGGEPEYSIVGPNYPGEQGVSIDVDSEDLVVFVTLGSAYFPSGPQSEEFTLQDKIDTVNDYFTVVDPFVGQSSEQDVNVGAKILAIDIDENDDIWALDINNVMHKYVKTSGYTEDITSQFDLDITSGGTFSGLVYDFIINFYNEAFFILTDGSLETDVWRFECDGQFNSLINGNPNPLENVLLEDTSGIADIGIDNLNSSGAVLTGEQDSQIVVAGCYYGVGRDSMISRVDSELNVPLQLTSAYEVHADGLTNVFFDQRSNDLWGWERGFWSSTFTERWFAPAAEWH
jgi:hypothetical protein